jgi:ubiquinone/menaquinone biosynthesis C-methylase UbiE
LSQSKPCGFGLLQKQTCRSLSSVKMAGTAQGLERPVTRLRLIQHKKEAFWFYRFLSVVYDHVVNPGHWTEEMREVALQPAKLEWPHLDTVDVGGGTGFCTIGIIKEGVNPQNIVMIDQSPHQLEKARFVLKSVTILIYFGLTFCVSRNKPELQDVRIEQGDAEELPFDTDSKDRYVSAGSIEYWPEPQRGICEAYRVLRPGGLACIIGPVYPTNPISRLLADIWFGPSLLVLAECEQTLTCKEVMQDAFSHRTGVHRMVSQRRLQGCSNNSHWTLVVPWCSKVAATSCMPMQNALSVFAHIVIPIFLRVCSYL